MAVAVAAAGAASRPAAAGRVNFDRLLTRVQLQLVEEDVTPVQLRAAAQLLQPTQFADACLERSLGGRCGYPLCAAPVRQTKSRGCVG